MADWEGGMSRSDSFGGWKFLEEEDFDEDDVWDVDKEKHDDSSSKLWRSDKPSGSSSARSHRTDPRTIPKVNAASSHDGKLNRRSSAPRDIPDWSKIYGARNARGRPSNQVYRDGEERRRHDNPTGHVGVGDGEDEDDHMVPPHEWIARKLSRSHISSFSVCEGVGRTLKGRDLSRVRNAVLTRTGFIEQRP